MIIRFLLTACLLLCTSCDRFKSEASYLNDLKERGFIVFVTRNALSTYYADKDNKWVGFEYELASKFAKEHGLELRVMVAKNVNQAFQFLHQGLGDFIGASLSLTDERKKQYRYTDSLHKIQQEVVCHRFGKKAKNRNRLSKINFVVAKGTSYEDYLKNLSRVFNGLKWATQNVSTEELLSYVNEKKVDCTVADSHILSLQQRIMPNLQSMFALSPTQGIHWYVKKDNHQLQRTLDRWIDKISANGDLESIVDKYFGFIETEFDYYDTKIFEERISSRLKKWKPLFLQAAKKYKIDWKLLAAISYQESHWNPASVSPTGVRGLMMLTLSTAARMGISDRTDPRQSIMAGAKYFVMLKKRYKEKVKEPDLTFFALAAYNVGPGHVDDLMELAVKRNQDQSKWLVIKELLPLLTRPEVYSELRYGYANGNEPLVYVDRVRNFLKILSLKKNV